jgi:hypothetical protein
MKNPENKLIEFFCETDEFNEVFVNQLQTNQDDESDVYCLNDLVIGII